MEQNKFVHPALSEPNTEHQEWWWRKTGYFIMTTTTLGNGKIMLESSNSWEVYRQEVL